MVGVVRLGVSAGEGRKTRGDVRFDRGIGVQGNKGVIAGKE